MTRNQLQDLAAAFDRQSRRWEASTAEKEFFLALYHAAVAYAPHLAYAPMPVWRGPADVQKRLQQEGELEAYRRAKIERTE